VIAPARIAAYEALESVASGKVDLGTAIANARGRLPDERDRALAGEIAVGTLRWQGAFDHVIARFASRPIKKLDPEVLIILRLTVFQLLHLDRIPAAAAVKDAVDLAGKAGKRSAAGLVNALLRRVSRERDRLPLPVRPTDDADRMEVLPYLSITLSHPEWIASRFLDRYGFANAARWEAFNNSAAPLTIRANSFKTTREDLRKVLASRGVETEPAQHARDGLVVSAGNPLRTTLDEEGLFVVQDEASQLVASYAGVQPGERGLDLCAAPGGKTTAMAAAMEGRGSLVACDVRGRRVRLLARTVRRSGAENIHIVQADATVRLPFGPVFDRVVLDAPCSGLGTLRRDPDIKWRRTPDDLPPLADAQLEMLRNAASTVASGGVLVYSTCSSEPEENDEVIARFLSRHREFRLQTPPDLDPSLERFVETDGRFRTLPHRDELEAFFAAMLVRVKHLR
jgi:16S rRNA (cytosine967-C5)-methyltransferase